MEKRRYIDAPRKLRMQIAEEVGITESAMMAALSFKRNGRLSVEARKRILDSEEAIVMNYLPECETIHDAEGVMTQIFGNGYLIRVQKNTGLVEVFDNLGALKSQDFNPSITEFSALQCKVETYKAE